MSNDRPIFVISDLHMGDGGPRDNFAVGNRQQELNQFLDYVKNANGKLIIVGDLFEFWQVSLGKVLAKRRVLFDQLAEIEAIYVIGNHDADLEALIGQNMLSHSFFNKMCKPFTREIGGKKFKFMHGHEVDAFNSGDAPSWGRMLAIFAGIFEEKNGSPIYATGETVESTLEKCGEWLLSFWNWLVAKLKKKTVGDNPPNPKAELTPVQNPNRIAEMIELYRKDKEKEGYDIAIVGHTHQSGRFENWYFNSGSWVEKENNFLQIASDGSVTCFNWQDGKAVVANHLIA